MNQTELLEKLRLAPESSFHILEPKKAKRMNAKTLFIPAPSDVAKVITAIPFGETRTILELRRELALLGKAETACPAKTIKYWKWLAFTQPPSFPWWRVLKDGKPSPHMPGGVEQQMALLEAEE
ncbi:MAG: hypothetical protein RLZZ156_1118 [Deinococcota bacterium]|jgi:alkylated DNA nucleotide flippase Atl1